MSGDVCEATVSDSYNAADVEMCWHCKVVQIQTEKKNVLGPLHTMCGFSRFRIILECLPWLQKKGFRVFASFYHSKMMQKRENPHIVCNGPSCFIAVILP